MDNVLLARSKPWPHGNDEPTIVPYQDADGVIDGRVLPAAVAFHESTPR